MRRSNVRRPTRSSLETASTSPWCQVGQPVRLHPYPNLNSFFMGEGITDDGDTGGEIVKKKQKKERWYQRSSVRKLKKEAEQEDREFSRKWDERENEETRLPGSEEIHLGGLVFTEAFTPSTV